MKPKTSQQTPQNTSSYSLTVTALETADSSAIDDMTVRAAKNLETQLMILSELLPPTLLEALTVAGA